MTMPRISRGYFPNRKSSGLSSAFYVSIFTRDIHTGIVPYRSSRKSTFKVQLSRKNQNLENRLTDSFSIGQYGGSNFTDTITNAIEMLSQYLATFGEVYLEIVDTKKTHKKGVTDKKLEFLPSCTVLRIFNKYIQLVPAKDWKRGEKKIYIIPADRIWHLKLPRELGTPRSHRKLLNKLKNLSVLMPEFSRIDGDLGYSAKYDSALHHDKKEQAVEQLTVNWGSIPSLRQINHTTEYYYIVNRLRFAHSQALIREHVIEEINNLILRLGINNYIKIEGLSLALEIQNTICKLENGEIGFTEAVDVINN